MCSRDCRSKFSRKKNVQKRSKIFKILWEFKILDVKRLINVRLGVKVSFSCPFGVKSQLKSVYFVAKLYIPYQNFRKKKKSREKKIRKFLIRRFGFLIKALCLTGLYLNLNHLNHQKFKKISKFGSKFEIFAISKFFFNPLW